MQTANIRLSFLTDTSQLVHLAVRRAGLGATDAMVDNAMDSIITANAYDTRGRGNLAQKYAARLILTDTTVFDVA